MTQGEIELDEIEAGLPFNVQERHLAERLVRRLIAALRKALAVVEPCDVVESLAYQAGRAAEREELIGWAQERKHDYLGQSMNCEGDDYWYRQGQGRGMEALEGHLRARGEREP